MSDKKSFGFTTAQRWNIFLVIFIFVGASMFSLFRPVSSLYPVFDEDCMTITGPENAPFTVTVSYTDILSVSLADSLEAGVCLEGVDTNRCWFGTWENDAYGSYTLCAVPSISSYIVLETTEGVIVFNYESRDTTTHLYTALEELLEEKGLKG